ncbi:MAG: hypothetical protein M3Q99_04085, partial [Acidobacteriota bacterium]|nr:hypothetical protein [Acidobacteriota bacterium]
ITYYDLIIAGVVIGILLGLIPLILGIKKKNRKYGMYGFVGSVIGGAITPIISIVVVSVFTWLILRKPKNKPKNEPIEVRVVNENPIDVKVDRSENQ